MKLRRNLTRFSLSTILAVMFVCALGFAAINWRLQWYQEQTSVAEEIRLMSVYLEMQPGSPAWLRQFTSDGQFESVKAVSFQGRQLLADSDLEILEKAPHLRVLSLHATAVTNDGMKHLSQFKMLDTLSLKTTEVSDEGLAKLAGLTSLIKLQLSNTKITGAGLKHLAAMKHLQHLELNNISLSDDDLKQLEHLSQLKVLYIHSDKMTGTGLASLNRLKNLTEIHIGSDSFEVVRLSNLPKLTTANFLGGDFKEIEIKDCPALENLAINARSHRGRKPPSLHLENLPKLEQLSYQAASSLTLKQLDFLEYVHIVGCKLERMELDGLPSVTHMQIDTTTLPPDAFHDMPELPALTTVVLSRLTFRDGVDGVRGLQAGDLTALNRHKEITHLAIRGKLIDPKVLAGIEKIPNLEILDFSACGIRDDHLRQLHVGKQLKTLTLSSNPIEGESFKDLSLDKLEQLNLSNCQLSDEGLEQIGSISTLVSLDILHAGVRGEQLRHLSHLYKLKMIKLNYNDINDEGINHLICLPEMNWDYVALSDTKVSKRKRQLLYGPPKMMTQPTPRVLPPNR